MACSGCRQFAVSFVGYQLQQVTVGDSCIVSLTPAQSLLKEVVVSANHGEKVGRPEAPVAIARISAKPCRFRYGFNNHLATGAFSGSPDTINHFGRLSPKIGFTYTISSRTGMYANYSEGFVPPQVTELYNGVKVPVG